MAKRGKQLDLLTGENATIYGLKQGFKILNSSKYTQRQTVWSVGPHSYYEDLYLYILKSNSLHCSRRFSPYIVLLKSGCDREEELATSKSEQELWVMDSWFSLKKSFP